MIKSTALIVITT